MTTINNNQSSMLNIDEISESSTSNKKTNDISSQRQLLNLAKQFSLTGGLRAFDKQVPIIERVAQHQQSCQIRQQQNLEAIIYQAIGYCSAKEVSGIADPDWFTRFIILAQDISNIKMQALWAKILAKEISQAGSFSLKTLSVFKNMTMSDAKLFAKVCTLAVQDNNSTNLRIISGAYQQPNLFSLFFGKKEQRIYLSEFGLNYSDLLALSENNLLFSHEAETRALQKNETLLFNHHGTLLTLKYKLLGVSLNFYKFTATGNELAQLIKGNTNEEFFAHLTTKLELLYDLN